MKYLSSLIFAMTISSPLVAAPSFTEKTINNVGWNVTFTGSSYDQSSNTTTFNYRLTAASGEKDLSHWVLSMTDSPVGSVGCELVKFGLDPTTGVSGWKCDDGQNTGTTQDYSITVNGHVGEAATTYSVKGGTYYAVGTTTGPGAVIASIITYSISGTVFVDANNNGEFNVDEPVLQNTTVNLSNGMSVKTDSKGYYTFENLTAGQYSVSVPGMTANVPDDFNETLSSYFTDTRGMEHQVTAGPNVTGSDFGFRVEAATVLADFDAADADGNGFTFSGTGKTIGFWKHQITSAKQGKTKGVQVSAAAVRDYLYSGTTSVKTMFADVFADIPVSTPGAYDYALAVLGSTSSDAVELLKKQLLGTELNSQAGTGISNTSLQNALVAWSEYLVKYNANFDKEQLLAAKDICDLINNSGE